MSSQKIKPSEITAESVYLNRRNFIRTGLLAGTGAATALTYNAFRPDAVNNNGLADIEGLSQGDRNLGAEALTALDDITNYNNFYEFSTSKTSVARAARALTTRPWTVEVGGLCAKPKTFGIEDLLGFPQEERIYRLRCVEAWSMVIPWVGFELRTLLERVEPLSTAKYVAFETKYDPSIMQSPLAAGIDLPYLEGLRLDEAMHPLTILATGLYGKEMPNQNGAPIRLVVPWKYGFKSIKSIVRITLTEDQPPTTWNKAQPTEYGFYSNVNPNVSHPRWSQARERRIGEYSMRDTLMFNGYADEVASLYAGMDLKKFF